MSDFEIGDKCPHKDCEGKFIKTELDGSCSCHISPPCSHCYHGQIECSECGFEHDSMENGCKTASSNKDDKYIATKKRTFNDLKKGTFDYLTIPGTYYFMEYKGYYPEGWSADELRSKFDTCFGYTNFSMKDGIFNIKVYTD